MSQFKEMVCEGKFASFGEFARYTYFRGFLGIYGNPDPKTARTFLKGRHDEQEKEHRRYLAQARADLVKAETQEEHDLQKEIDALNGYSEDKEYADEMARIRAAGLTAHQARKEPLAEMSREVWAWDAPKELRHVQTYLSDVVEEESVPESCRFDKHVWTTAEYRTYRIKKYQEDIRSEEVSLAKYLKAHKEELRCFDAFEASITEYEQQQKKEVPNV